MIETPRMTVVLNRTRAIPHSTNVEQEHYRS